MTTQVTLPSRYEIRTLEPKHREWAAAIISHSMMLHSPAWSVIYAKNGTQQTYRLFKALGYQVDRTLASGFSLGMFDNEYQFKRKESAATEGALYWDVSDESADSASLLEQMDFPLVSVSLSYDNFSNPDPAKLKPLIDSLPEFVPVKKLFDQCDTRDPDSWKAKEMGEVLSRGGTDTRRDYEGRGLMKALAHRTMRDAAEKGFRAITIDCMADAVRHVWANPPAPFRSEIVCSWSAWDCEVEDEAGEKRYPFRPSTQEGARIFCMLR